MLNMLEGVFFHPSPSQMEHNLTAAYKCAFKLSFCTKTYSQINTQEDTLRESLAHIPQLVWDESVLQPLSLSFSHRHARMHTHTEPFAHMIYSCNTQDHLNWTAVEEKRPFHLEAVWGNKWIKHDLGGTEGDELVLASFTVVEDLSKSRAMQRVASLTTSNESNKILWVVGGRRGARIKRRTAPKKFFCHSYWSSQ